MRPHSEWSADRRQVSAVGVVDGKSSIGCVRCARLVQPGATRLQRPSAVTLGGAYAAVPARCCLGRKNVICHVRWRLVGSGQAAGDRLRQT